MSTQHEIIAEWIRKKLLRDIEALMLKAASNRKGRVAVSGKKLKKWYTRIQEIVEYLTEEIDITKYKQEKYSDLESMEVARDRLDRESNEIQLLVDLAKARAHTNDQWADPSWFARANHAIRWRRSEFNRLNKEISEIRKRQRREWQDRQERRFIDLCRERLSQEIFSSLWADAQTIKG